MRSIRDLYLIGHGPSSSHTMGPGFACDYILNKYHDIKEIKVILYGSLALTGKGHLTDQIIYEKFSNYPLQVEFDYHKRFSHPNVLEFYIKDSKDNIHYEKVTSTGGGTIKIANKRSVKENDIYPHHFLQDILTYCKQENISLVDYIKRFEDENILSYMEEIYQTMETSRKEGLAKDGYLPGVLKVPRKAHEMYLRASHIPGGMEDVNNRIAITAFAVAEENASGGVVVTAPTCGSAGVVPGVISYCVIKGIPHEKILDALLVAGLLGMIVKTNASVSGAECGCQAEIGVACMMGASLVATCFDFSNEGIAQCSEIALEHSLGLTCDPVNGYVQIPCIERCAMYALKAVDAVTLMQLLPSSKAKVSFDDIVKTMYLTGKDIKKAYKETSISGLAKIVK